jgi:tRNA(Leu) C34 or U34 (ribose-2'-O)-methylase TrmL
VGSCRREILDHVIALNEQHLRRLVRDYVSYHHHRDHIHDALDKDTPNRRLVELTRWSRQHDDSLYSESGFDYSHGSEANGIELRWRATFHSLNCLPIEYADR